MARRADGILGIAWERIMDSIENFLQIKILGVDMIGIFGVLFIVAMVYAFGGKRGAKSEWRVLIRCLVVGVLGLMTALVMYEREAKAVEVLKTWTKTDGVVTRMEQLEFRGARGQITYTNRATVVFEGADGKRKEGLLFHEEHAQGESVTVFYDPHKDYTPGAPIYNGARDLQTTQGTARETGSELRLVGVISLLVGGGALSFGCYRLYYFIRKGTRAREVGHNSTKLIEV
jgi:hypothetical protein